MFTTLIIQTDFIKNAEKPYRDLDSSLRTGIYDRCELPLISSQGIDFLHDRKNSGKFIKCAEVVHKNNVKLVLSHAIYQKNDNTDTSICAYEATGTARIRVENRVCPFNNSYKERFISKFRSCLREARLPRNVELSLAYFRYKNLYQCVCDNCLSAFGKLMNSKGKRFNFENSMSILNGRYITEWVKWRKKVMNSVIDDIIDSVDSQFIIEIDFDHTKQYLSGVGIEEGLDFTTIIKRTREIYLHIEPKEEDANFLNFSSEIPNQRESYLNHLRYTRSLIESQHAKLTLFFWFLSKRAQVNRNIPIYLELIREVSPHGAAFYTNDPVSFTDSFTRHISRH
jgi:hypothetical protein